MTPTELLAAWDAGTPVRLYVSRGPGYFDAATMFTYCKVQMEALRIALNRTIAQWNNLAAQPWQNFLNSARAASGALGLSVTDLDDAANIGGGYRESGYDELMSRTPLVNTVVITKAGVIS